MTDFSPLTILLLCSGLNSGAMTPCFFFYLPKCETVRRKCQKSVGNSISKWVSFQGNKLASGWRTCQGTDSYPFKYFVASYQYVLSATTPDNEKTYFHIDIQSKKNSVLWAPGDTGYWYKDFDLCQCCSVGNKWESKKQQYFRYVLNCLQRFMTNYQESLSQMIRISKIYIWKCKRWFRLLKYRVC